jgi:hypothetical protein
VLLQGLHQLCADALPLHIGMNNQPPDVARATPFRSRAPSRRCVPRTWP